MMLLGVPLPLLVDAAVTHNVWHIWLFPEPNSPVSSVIAWDSTPPFRKASRLLEPVVYLTSDFLLSKTWSAVENSLTSAPESARAFLAFSTNSDIVSMSAEIAFPSYSAPASSLGVDAARSRTELTPASFSLLIKCDCTPGKSSNCKSLTWDIILFDLML